MSRAVTFTTHAQKDLAAIEQRTRQRIIVALARYAETDDGDVKKLAGADPEWRLRVGDWRVRFTFLGVPPEILVLRVLNRRDAYR